MTVISIDSAIQTGRHRRALPRLYRLAALLMVCLLLVLDQQAAQAEAQYWVYTVRPGDNIWNLTEKYCVSVLHWKRIQRLNNVRLDRQIPPGTTISYAELAERVGKPTATRAVASACGANKIAVAIPCHRVVRKDGGLSGYRWGVERKRALLDRER